MRTVTFYEWHRSADAKYTDPYQKREAGKGKFHEFGVDFEELEQGVGNFSIGIIETPDGKIINVPVNLIIFDVETEL